MFRQLRIKRLPRARKASLRVEQMEERELLSALPGPVSVPPHLGTTPPIIVRPPVTSPPPNATPPA